MSTMFRSWLRRGGGVRGPAATLTQVYNGSSGSTGLRSVVKRCGVISKYWIKMTLLSELRGHPYCFNYTVHK